MSLTAKDHRERVALFRAHVLQPVLYKTLPRGILKAELAQISTCPFLPPDQEVSRTFSVPTLLRWRRAFLKGGLAALAPEPREDRGHARALTAEQKTLLLDIRRDHPTVSAELILRTLVGDGRLDVDRISAVTVRRLFAEHGLFHAQTGRAHGDLRQRLPWQRAEPNELWHADVCHGPDLGLPGKRVHLRIHGILDDASRDLIALEARTNETEDTLLGVLVDAVKRRGRPDGLYLDNGSTYRGDTLAIACGRLGMSLLHARPYDPMARGKMERVWRTMRAQCLDFVTHEHSLAEVQARLDRFKNDYRHHPHAGLVGKAPAVVYEARTRTDVIVTERALTAAFTIEQRRRVRQDSTLSLDGVLYEVGAAFLAGRIVTVRRCHLPGLSPDYVAVIDWDGKIIPLTPADPRRNAHRRRRQHAEEPKSGVPFDPGATRASPPEDEE